MQYGDATAYGLWLLAALNAAVFIFFAFSFAKPGSLRDWRSFGAFSGFIIALFAEMYGFPLTIYLLSGWLQSRYPRLDLLTHDAGHIWWTLGGQKGNPHFELPHLLSLLLLGGGSGCWLGLGRCCTLHSAGGASPSMGLMPVYGIRNMSRLSSYCWASSCSGRRC